MKQLQKTHEINVIRLGLFIFLTLSASMLVWSQTTIERLKNQPYLKYRDRVNCQEAFTTLDQRVCANLRAQTSDSLLLVAYYELAITVGKIPNGKALEHLEKAQEHWIKMRDAECAIFWEQYEGGSLQPVVYMNCLADRIDARTLALQALLTEIEPK